MLSVVIQSLKKSVIFLDTPFANHCLIYSDWAFEFTLHSSPARQDSARADSPEWDSLDHRSVCNKEIKFTLIYPLKPRFSVFCLY